MDQSSIKFPRASVKIVFRCGDSVLYYKKTNGINDIPGGHIEFGEDILEALKRELMEELGFSLISEPVLFHAWSYFSRDKSAHRVYFVYLLELPEKLQFKSLEEPDDIEFIWATKDDILEADIMAQQKEFLIKALDYKIKE